MRLAWGSRRPCVSQGRPREIQEEGEGIGPLGQCGTQGHEDQGNLWGMILGRGQGYHGALGPWPMKTYCHHQETHWMVQDCFGGRDWLLFRNGLALVRPQAV